MDKDMTKRYTNGEVTIVWKPNSCIHSTICWKTVTGLPDVFNPRIRPWIKMENATTEKLIEQVKKCPSGALSIYSNNDEAQHAGVFADTKVEEMPNGPLMVYGNITVKDKSGIEHKKFKVTAFCRCGHSQNKPYCDGSHVAANFQG